ncbi:MAG: hypothetical protein K2K32_11640 [Muribaculaceae bacterium]|nr:hypothetical protein [Muribaculaceae bacterium]
MSGLFALWQWMVCDTFRNIASLSGSFWYEGFMEWMKSRTIPTPFLVLTKPLLRYIYYKRATSQ